MAHVATPEKQMLGTVKKPVDAAKYPKPCILCGHDAVTLCAHDVWGFKGLGCRHLGVL